MLEEGFIFDDQLFDFKKQKDHWELCLKRSDIASQDLRELSLLELHHPFFLEQKMEADEDQVTFHYQVEAYGVTYEEMKKRPVSERLRLALNIFALEVALKLPVTFLLHPENLFLTKDAQVKIAYRGVPGLMVPRSLDSADFLRQAQCFVVTLFSDLDFMELYNGTLELADLPEFLIELRQAEDIATARGILERTYQEQVTKEKESLVLVSGRSHRLYKLATIWLGVGISLLMIPLVYLVFFQNPFNEKLLEADTAFIKLDYSGVIDQLEGVSPAQLPTTQKYELAYSYIQGLEFSDDQKKVILNNVSLKSDELYLTYWIQIGRHDFEAALDTGKRLDESDLILYALSQEIERVRSDEELSGADRDSKLESLEGEYKKYWDNRSELLTSGSSSDGTASSTGTSSSSTGGQ